MAKKHDLPYMPFYVGDWLKAPEVQCLPYDLQGLWFAMLCYMWESVERGYLVDASGTPYSLSELSMLLRLPEQVLEQKLQQLSSKKVYSVREKDEAIFSRRMVRDEEIRVKRQKAGSLGGKKTFAKAFGQAKSEANVENEIENEIDIDNEDIIKKGGAGGKQNLVDELIEMFAGLYQKQREMPYLKSEKDKKAVGMMLSRYRKSNPEADTDKCKSDMTVFFNQCLNISNKWLYENMTLSIVNSKINEIRTILRGQNGRTDDLRELQQALDSF